MTAQDIIDAQRQHAVLLQDAAANAWRLCPGVWGSEATDVTHEYLQAQEGGE